MNELTHLGSPTRRLMLAGAAAAFLPAPAGASLPERRFEPRPGRWRTFEVTTRIELQTATGASRVWIPLPSVEGEYQRLSVDGFASNGQAAIGADRTYGARYLRVDFEAQGQAPYAEVTSRIATQDRAVDWSRRGAPALTRDERALWTRPTELIPLDGIVARTAREAVGDAKGDEEKVRRIYDWIVARTHREPKVRGCGTGDIRTMLETGDLGGKCADINALFVGLCRASGVPARDVYGIRLAPSAFGYRELSGNASNLKAAQHCRAEVHMAGHGWVAMDPADVAKVMRQETAEWIRSPEHPLVAPVYRGLYGGWEGNWLAYNMAHDLQLPGARHGRLGFFMYPVAEDGNGRYDSLDADSFRYAISAREIVG